MIIFIITLTVCSLIGIFILLQIKPPIPKKDTIQNKGLDPKLSSPSGLKLELIDASYEPKLGHGIFTPLIYKFKYYRNGYFSPFSDPSEPILSGMNIGCKDNMIKIGIAKNLLKYDVLTSDVSLALFRSVKGIDNFVGFLDQPENDKMIYIDTDNPCKDGCDIPEDLCKFAHKDPVISQLWWQNKYVKK